MKVTILILLTILTLGVASFFAFKANSNSAKLQSPLTSPTDSPIITKPTISTKTKNFSDPSGFKFEYPENLTPETIDKKDPDYYSSILLKDKSKTGKMTINLTSTKYTTVEEWAKNNKEIANNSIDTMLADLEAKKISSSGKLMIVAVDVETLISLTADFPNEETEYWNSTVKTVADSFEFEQPAVQNVTSQSESSTDDVVFEGEEIIEQ